MSSRIKQLGITPRKSLGQNFLVDDGYARRIVAAAGIDPDDLVFEIGPGIGALTTHLAQRAAHVIAIELDQALIAPLRLALGAPEQGNRDTVDIIHADALEVDYSALAAGAARAQQFEAIRFVGNLPYYITSAAIRVILESGLTIARAVLTVQAEVAERAAAKPPDMSLLAVSVQFYGVATVLFRLPPAVFYPQPGVESAVLQIAQHTLPLFDDPTLFFRWVKAGFSQPRKQLRNTLAAGLNMPKHRVESTLAQAQIDPARRPETLTVQDWISVAHAARETRAHGE